MNRILTTLCAGVAAVAVAGTVAAGSADAAPTLSRADAVYLKANGQTSLAELSLAKIVLVRSKGPRAKELARVTAKDHAKALVLVAALAKKDGVRLWKQPNPSQRATAAALKKAVYVSYTYFVDQIAGHKLSIKSTKAEIAHGTNSGVIAYAKAYLPVAEMHLAMAQKDLKLYEAR